MEQARQRAIDDGVEHLEQLANAVATDRPALFGALRLPENFGAFVTDLAACRDAPAGIAALQHGVARYEGMTRILRRKT